MCVSVPYQEDRSVTLQEHRYPPPSTALIIVASRASWFCRTHRGDSILVDLNDIASGVSGARESSEASWSPRDDRVGLSAALDRVPLFDFLVEEHIESVLACAKGVDLTHAREYRKLGPPPRKRTPRRTQSGRTLALR